MGCKTPSKNDTLGGVYEPYFYYVGANLNKNVIH